MVSGIGVIIMKKDLRMLVVGLVSLLISIILAVVTVAVFTVQLGKNIASYDWNKTYTGIQDGIQEIVDDLPGVEIDDVDLTGITGDITDSVEVLETLEEI